ncbi:MAG: hypothetical protein OHK0029_09550 [Armatimonadaceae bacterium]
MSERRNPTPDMGSWKLDTEKIPGRWGRWRSRHSITASFSVGLCVLLVVYGGIRTSGGNPAADRELITAVQAGDANALQTALTHGADPNARRASATDISRLSTLWLRSLYFWQPGNSRSARREVGFAAPTALFLAVRAGDEEAVRQLLRAGASPTIPCLYGQTALMAAVEGAQQADSPRSRIVQALLTAGADPNQSDADGRTALMVAVYSFAAPEVVDALIDAGADPHQRMMTGASARDFLTSATPTEVVALLKKP